MSRKPAAAASGNGRTRLDREVVVTAALAFIDEHGPHALSMRKLGEQLGVEAMSLYRYVTGREDLLEAVVAQVLHGVEQHLDDDLTDSWQGYLQATAHEIRAIAVDHPKVFPLVATTHPAAPWLRPPLRSLELVEQFLSTLTAHGFDEERVVQIYRAFTSFLLGHLLLESVVQGAETSPAELALDEGAAEMPGQDAGVDLGETPTVLRMRRLLSEDRAAEEFEISLETLLDRLEQSLSQ